VNQSTLKLNDYFVVKIQFQQAVVFEWH